MNFLLQRFFSILLKEFIQIRRDPVTIAMLVMIPLIQLVLFGFAINQNPHHLPTVIVSNDHSPLTRDFIDSVQNTDYFQIINSNATEQQANRLLANGKAQFIINIPTNFSKKMIRGESPEILVTADASDPSSTGNAISALNALPDRVFQQDLQGSLNYLQSRAAPFNLVIHMKYNPEQITQYNIVPGLMGVVLTMSLVMVTAMAITREYEQGTMESLLATPVRPLEVMLGKITPYVLVGYVQQVIILMAAVFLFGVPNQGSVLLLIATTFPFIVANLSLGLTFSTIAKNQLQAMQLTFFFFLPSLLLSGFMFPFYGMPLWAQHIGEVLPLTHFLRIVRGIMLKGNDVVALWPDIWPILIFLLLTLIVSGVRYRQTLD